MDGQFNMKRMIITAISCIVIWGITFAAVMSESDFGLIVLVICAIFGWQALNKIQPSMFLWMSWVGWLIYFFIKFMISAVIGVFVAPFVIGRKLGGVISDVSDEVSKNKNS